LQDFATAPGIEKMSSTQNSLEAADIKEMQTTKQIEVAGELTWTPEEEKALVRKIDLFLLPTIWLMYLLSYMDRTKYVINLNAKSKPQSSISNTSVASVMRGLLVWPPTSSSPQTNTRLLS
jgi:hypothetical protein